VNGRIDLLATPEWTVSKMSSLGRIAPIVAALAILGCARGTGTRMVTGPNGRPAAAITCRKSTDCLELAGRACPYGYWTLERSQGQGSAGNATMLIECRPADPWAECSTKRDRWDACVAAGGKCLPTGDGGSRCSWPQSQAAPPR